MRSARVRITEEGPNSPGEWFSKTVMGKAESDCSMVQFCSPCLWASRQKGEEFEDILGYTMNLRWRDVSAVKDTVLFQKS